MPYHVVIVDRFGNTVKNSMDLKPSDPLKAADKFSAANPECWVTLKQYTDGDDFYSLMPLNMKRDEDRIDSGDMSFDEFHEYWYPVKSDRVRKALVKELNNERKALEQDLAVQAEIDRMIEEKEAEEMLVDQYEIED